MILIHVIINILLISCLSLVIVGCENNYEPTGPKQEKKTQPQDKQKKESEKDDDVDVILMPSASGMTMVVVWNLNILKKDYRTSIKWKSTKTFYRICR